jgi:hypothetical protein
LSNCSRKENWIIYKWVSEKDGKFMDLQRTFEKELKPLRTMSYKCP